MMLSMLKGKIHRARVTESDLNYEGSIGLDRDWMDAVGILPHEQVDVYNITNGARFTTYAIEGPRGSRQVQVNGAAARLVQKGDLVIVCAYAFMADDQARIHKPVVFSPESPYNVDVS